MTLKEKYDALKNYIASLGSVAVAFSGGVDSTLLLKISHDVLGDKAVAVTAGASFVPSRELDEAKDFCKKNNIRQIIFHVNESSIPNFKANPKNRCYFCKLEIFKKILSLDSENNLAHVVEGSNVDDLGDFRPGLRALRELEIKSPLRVAELTKAEIRLLSRELGLPTFDKPSYACLASRFVYGEEITPEKLKMVEEAEEFLRALGFKQLRVRIHGLLARIEIMPEDFNRVLNQETREKIYQALKNFGFSYVALDLKGYRSGSMNEAL